MAKQYNPRERHFGLRLSEHNKESSSKNRDTAKVCVKGSHGPVVLYLLMTKGTPGIGIHGVIKKKHCFVAEFIADIYQQNNLMKTYLCRSSGK